MMRILTILTLVAALGWGGWWFVGARTIRTTVEASIASARDEGWRVDLADLTVTGFPNRFDTRISRLDLDTPDRQWGLVAPFLQVFALSYRPNRIIAIPASDLSVRTPSGPVAVTYADLRASATVSLVGGADLTRATVVTEALDARGRDWTVTLASGQVAMRSGPAPDSYDLAATFDDLALETDRLDPRLPERIDAFDLDATVTLDGPVAEGGQFLAANLRRLEGAWDGIRLGVGGVMEVAPSGFLTGDLVLSVEGWRDLLALAETFDVPPAQLALLSGGFGELEQDGRVDVPLTLRDGAIYFGAIPLAPLPRLNTPYNP
ncbi:MAG: DUF2125 domain-containing protein [Jannaschia sp.]